MTGACDATSGFCTIFPVSNSPVVHCSHGEAESQSGVCVDGICVKNLHFSDFQLIGEGLCVDRMGRRMAEYYGDVADVQQCRAACLEDWQCAGYSYSFPTCRLHGPVRAASPSEEWAFLPGDQPPAISIESSAGVLRWQRETVCYAKAPKGNQLEQVEPNRVAPSWFLDAPWLALIVLCLTSCFWGPPVYRCIRAYRGVEDDEDESAAEKKTTKLAAWADVNKKVEVTMVEPWKAPAEDCDLPLTTVKAQDTLGLSGASWRSKRTDSSKDPMELTSSDLWLTEHGADIDLPSQVRDREFDEASDARPMTPPPP